MSVIDLKPFDFFRIVELFLKAIAPVQSTLNPTTTTIATNSTTKTVYTSTSNKATEIGGDPTTSSSTVPFYLDNDMIKHLSNCEERILESLAWEGNSPLWIKLNELKLNPNFGITFRINDLEMGAQLNSNILFPLYEDVFPKNGATTSILNTSSIVSNIQGTNDLTSSVKHPTITRVVCSQTNNNINDQGSMILASPNKSTKQIQVQN